MRYEERDEREAYRSGARDCFESLAKELGVRRTRQIEAWLKDLDGWEYGEPPSPPQG
jgi:hypothetical protein